MSKMQTLEEQMEWWFCSETESQQKFQEEVRSFLGFLSDAVKICRDPRSICSSLQETPPLRNAVCIHVDVLLLETQIGACRDAIRMQLRTFIWTREVPSLCFFFPCAMFYPSCAKNVNEDSILCHFNHIEVKPLNSVSFKCKKMEEKKKI